MNSKSQFMIRLFIFGATLPVYFSTNKAFAKWIDNYKEALQEGAIYSTVNAITFYIILLSVVTVILSFVLICISSGRQIIFSDFFQCVVLLLSGLLLIGTAWQLVFMLQMSLPL